MSVPNGGDVAEQMVKVMIDGAEQILKFTGENAIEMAALFKALFEKASDKTPLGKTRAYNLVKDGHELSAFTIEAKDRKQFEKIANDLLIPYTTIKSKTDKESCNVIFRSCDKSRINEALGKFNCKVIEKESDDPNAKKKTLPLFEEHSSPSSNGDVNLKMMMNDQPVLLPQEAIKDQNQFKHFLLAQNALMDRYSPKNQSLILEQKPSASLVMSKKDWREMGRTVNADAQQLMINMPRFEEKSGLIRDYAKVPVYDISDTDGDPIRQPQRRNDLESKRILDKAIEKSKMPIEYENNNESLSMYDPQSKVIFLHKGSPQVMFCLLLKEKAHALLHQKQGESYKREDNELAATAIAFRLSEKLNIDNPSLDFSPLLEQGKTLDEKQLSELVKEIDSGYKTLSKELEIQKDAPQISTPAIKTEKER